jgi:hypothetical protein
MEWSTSHSRSTDLLGDNPQNLWPARNISGAPAFQE